jgi:5-methylcytosine-specific restriction endonuclease McrA
MPELRVLSLSNELIKFCPGCKQTLPYDAFNKSKNRANGLAPYCRNCVSEKSKAYRAANLTKLREIAAKSRDKNRDSINTWHREHYWANRETEILRGKTYRHENVERVRKRDRERYYATHEYQCQRSKSYAEKHKEARSEYRKIYHKNNPLKARTYNKTRRANIAKAGGSYTKEQWAELCNKYHNICLSCGNSGPLTTDHIIPVSLGGDTNITNIQPLCSKCNKEKGQRIIDYRK